MTGVLRRSSVPQIRAAEVLRALYNRNFGTKSSDRKLFDELVSRDVFREEAIPYDTSADGLTRPSASASSSVCTAIAVLEVSGLVEKYRGKRGLWAITEAGREEAERMYPELRISSTVLPMDSTARPR